MNNNTQEFEKIRYPIQIVLVSMCLVIGLYLYWIYSKGMLSEDNARFWLGTLILPLALFEFVSSFVTGNAIAKGIVLNRETYPVLFFITELLYLVLMGLCITGIIYYW